MTSANLTFNCFNRLCLQIGERVWQGSKYAAETRSERGH
jgi:hypothetical protein